MAMETIAQALSRLAAAGYTDDYRAESGRLRSSARGTVEPPDQFRVDEVVRFEGESDPSDESAVFALTSKVDGTKGTYTVAFGPLMDAADTEIVARLELPSHS